MDTTDRARRDELYAHAKTACMRPGTRVLIGIYTHEGETYHVFLTAENTDGKGKQGKGRTR